MILTEKETLAAFSFAYTVLPPGILELFSLVSTEETASKLTKAEQETRIVTDSAWSDIDIHVKLDERDNRTDEQKTKWRSNGYTETTVVQDFPIRDRKVFLHIRRRRWLDEEGKSVMCSLDYEIVANGIKLSPQFADFLKIQMDKSPVSAKQLGTFYRVEGGKLERAYKEYLSNFRTWDQLSHCADWVLIPENIGVSNCIDETMIGEEFYTILSNRDAHGKSGAVIAMVKGTCIETVSPILMQIPEDKRLAVKEVTMDLSDSMRGIIRKCFPNAMITLDNFHLSKQINDCIDEIRLKEKRIAGAERKKMERQFKAKQNTCKRRNKKYAKMHPSKYKGKKRGRKPIYTGAFKPPRHINGDTEVELLTRCKHLLSQTGEKWGDSKKLRAKILFERYPKIYEAYCLMCKWKAIFRDKNLTRESAKDKIHAWYDAVTKCTLREMKSVRDTFKEREEDILNFFVNRASNAPAESLNSKIKCFRSLLRGVSDIDFFTFRVATVLG